MSRGNVVFFLLLYILCIVRDLDPLISSLLFIFIYIFPLGHPYGTVCFGLTATREKALETIWCPLFTLSRSQYFSYSSGFPSFFSAGPFLALRINNIYMHFQFK